MTIPDWLRPRTGRGQAAHGGGFPPLTAQQALEARREALALAEDEGALALCANACLVARGVRKGEAAFPLGQGGAGGLWAGGDRDPGPAVGGLEPEGGPGARLGARAAGGPKGPAGRLTLATAQWRVLRQFRALPTEGRARAMTGEDYLWCAANLLLDGEEALDQLCPHCRQGGGGGPVPGVRPGYWPERPRGQPAFDWARFTALKEETET